MNTFWKKRSYGNRLYLREKTARGSRETAINIWESWDGDYWLYDFSINSGGLDKTLIGKYKNLAEAKKEGEKLLTNHNNLSI